MKSKKSKRRAAAAAVAVTNKGKGPRTNEGQQQEEEEDEGGDYDKPLYDKLEDRRQGNDGDGGDGADYVVNKRQKKKKQKQQQKSNTGVPPPPPPPVAAAAAADEPSTSKRQRQQKQQQKQQKRSEGDQNRRLDTLYVQFLQDEPNGSKDQITMFLYKRPFSFTLIRNRGDNHKPVWSTDNKCVTTKAIDDDTGRQLKVTMSDDKAHLWTMYSKKSECHSPNKLLPNFVSRTGVAMIVEEFEQQPKKKKKNTQQQQEQPPPPQKQKQSPPPLLEPPAKPVKPWV